MPSRIASLPSTSSQLALSNVYPNLWFNQVPEVVRFITASSLGNVAFFKIDQALYNLIILPFAKDMPKFLQKNKESVSFFLAYLMQVGLQHFLNAFFVYGLQTIETRDKYLDTLGLTYSSYSFSLIGSTIGNAVLMQRGIPKNVAFWSTILGFGVVNFFLLRYLIAGGVDKVDEGTKKGGSVVQKKKGKQIPQARSGVLKKIKRGGQQIYSSECLIRGALSHVLFGTKVDPMLEIVMATGNK